MKEVLTLLKDLRKIRLTKSERVLLSERISEYQAFKPVRVSETSRHTTQSHSWLGITFKKQSMPLIAGLLIAATLGGGTAYGAELAVPGDVLYSIKTEITEPLRGTFAFNLESQAAWEARLAERRLEEAQTLSARGELSAEQQSDLETRFAKHKERAEAKTAQVKERDPALAIELKTRFEASVDAHLAVLTGQQPQGGVSAIAMNQVDSSEDTETAALATRSFVEGEVALLPVFNVGGRIEASVEEESLLASEQVALRLQKAARASIGDAEKLLDRLQPKLEKEIYVRAEAEIDRALELYGKGEVHMKESSYREAYQVFTQVIRSMKHFTVALTAWTQGDAHLDFMLESDLIISDPIPVEPDGGIGDGAGAPVIQILVPEETEGEPEPTSGDADDRPLPLQNTEVKKDTDIRIQI